MRSYPQSCSSFYVVSGSPDSFDFHHPLFLMVVDVGLMVSIIDINALCVYNSKQKHTEDKGEESSL